MQTSQNVLILGSDQERAKWVHQLIEESTKEPGSSMLALLREPYTPSGRILRMDGRPAMEIAEAVTLGGKTILVGEVSQSSQRWPDLRDALDCHLGGFDPNLIFSSLVILDDLHTLLSYGDLEFASTSKSKNMTFVVSAHSIEEIQSRFAAPQESEYFLAQFANRVTLPGASEATIRSSVIHANQVNKRLNMDLLDYVDVFGVLEDGGMLITSEDGAELLVLETQ